MSPLCPHLQAPDLFGDLPGVSEVAARYAGHSRALTSTASLRADTSISGQRVARELDAIIGQRGRPDTIVSDNGPELTPTHGKARWNPSDGNLPPV